MDGSPIQDLCLTFELPGTDSQAALLLSLRANRSSDSLVHQLWHCQGMTLLSGDAGHPEYELIAGGGELAVSASNVGDYIEAVVNATLSDGIRGQMKAFRSRFPLQPNPLYLPHLRLDFQVPGLPVLLQAILIASFCRDGFGEALSLDTLKCFHEDELEAMLCGQGEQWTVEMLTDALKFDHGYVARIPLHRSPFLHPPFHALLDTCCALVHQRMPAVTHVSDACRYTSSSTAIRHFLEILSELDAADQRRFLRFVTGSPRLPPGGLSALHPKCAQPFF